ncbi:copper resistance CopC/CopD family protein [Kitasatospora acidiphila]|uniref:copper resistance CopC/CopD family protein n=1 Tax=Kitasatospora acidiphila TaxID=2567942 RepID=UPI0015F0EF70|nr:copper resistance protein CopC [Kitasatospora acidiphila]
MRRIVVAAGLALGALLALAGPAAAHASLVCATPPNGAVLAAEPRQLTLRFSEPVTLALSSVRVIGPDGRRVDSGPLRGADSGGGAATVAMALSAEERPGTFVLNWRATAADDGHTTTGTLTFSVGAPSRTIAAGGAERSDPVTDAVLNLAVWLGFAGLAALVGYAAIRLYCLPPGAPTELRWPATLGWTALLAGTLLQLFSYGPATQGESLAHLADRNLLAATLPTDEGKVLVARILLLALTAAAGGPLLRRSVPGGIAAVALTLLLALTWSETSHAAEGTLVPIALLVTTLHVAAMAVWAGGLLTLAVLLQRGSSAPLLTTTARFSRLAFGAVGLLVVTGLYQAFRELGSPAALTGTPYGRLLLAKAGVLLAVLAVAAVGRSRLSRRDTLPSRAVLLELAGATVLLVITVLLIGSAPAGR